MEKRWTKRAAQLAEFDADMASGACHKARHAARETHMRRLRRPRGPSSWRGRNTVTYGGELMWQQKTCLSNPQLSKSGAAARVGSATQFSSGPERVQTVANEDLGYEKMETSTGQLGSPHCPMAGFTNKSFHRGSLQFPTAGPRPQSMKNRVTTERNIERKKRRAERDNNLHGSSRVFSCVLPRGGFHRSCVTTCRGLKPLL